MLRTRSALALLAALVTVVLVGCGSDAEPDDPEGSVLTPEFSADRPTAADLTGALVEGLEVTECQAKAMVADPELTDDQLAAVAAGDVSDLPSAEADEARGAIIATSFDCTEDTIAP